MTISWGNPELKSFRNNYVRRVIVDLARVFVHKNITNQVEELLLRASSHGASFSPDGLPNILPSLDVDDSLESQLGLKFQIPNFFTPIEVADLGFEQFEDIFIYKNVEVELSAEPEVSLPSYIDEVSEKIGGKQLVKGSEGKDVKFLAYFLGMENPSQKKVFDDEMAVAIKYFQHRMGIPENGEADWYTWHSIIPSGNERIAAGYAGVKVRALQSALIVNNYNPPVTSRFGTETIKAVREFQVKNGLRPTGRIGFLEWNILFALK